MPVDLAPGDVIQLSRAYHDGAKMILDEAVVLFVIAVFTDILAANFLQKVSRAPDRILVMPAGTLQVFDLQQHWVRSNCKRLTMWQTRSPL